MDGLRTTKTTNALEITNLNQKKKKDKRNWRWHNSITMIHMARWWTWRDLHAQKSKKYRIKNYFASEFPSLSDWWMRQRDSPTICSKKKKSAYRSKTTSASTRRKISNGISLEERRGRGRETGNAPCSTPAGPEPTNHAAAEHKRDEKKSKDEEGARRGRESLL